MIADTDPRRIDIAVGNLENGALIRNVAPHLFGSRGYDFDRLVRLFEPTRHRPPALIGLCEGKLWGQDGRAAGYAAANTLAVALGRPYVIEFGHLDRGPAGPVVMYDPNVLRVDYFGDQNETVWDDKQNLTTFHLAADPTSKLWFTVEHWHHNDRDRRLAEARRCDGLGEAEVPVILAGDLNSTASGQHLPQRRWHRLPMAARHAKGHQPDGPGTPHVAETGAVDHLIGHWMPAKEGTSGRRVDGVGFYAACEIAAFRDGMDPEKAFRSTLARGVDRDEPLLNDWALLNERAKDLLVPETYTVHVYDGPGTPPSDHELLTFSLSL